MPITNNNQTQQKFADTATPFNVTLTTAGTAQDLVAVPALKKGRTIALVNDGPGDVAIAFDTTATVTALVIKAGEAYSDEALQISTKLSFINVTLASTPTVRGVLWSGPA